MPLDEVNNILENTGTCQDSITFYIHGVHAEAFSPKCFDVHFTLLSSLILPQILRVCLEQACF